MLSPRIGNFDATENQLHRVIVNSGVRMHQAHHMEAVPTGEEPSKGPLVRGGYGSSNRGSQTGKLKRSD